MGRAYPERVTIGGVEYVFDRVLKDDFFSVNALYRGEDGARWVLKVSDFRFLFGKLLRPLAALESGREYRIYQRIADLDGVPALGPRYGGRGYFHKFIDGVTLHDVAERNLPVPDNFFDALHALYDAIHARRVLHIDSNKRGNIIVGDDARPYLIDFQISLHLGPGFIRNKIFNAFRREDIYHVYKHKKRFRPDLMREEEHALATRSQVNTWVKKWLGDPYRRVKRKIYPSGSNEIIWYKWKKMDDRSKRTP